MFGCGAFQSTHPIRDATNVMVHESVKASVSIHAPHPGCDTIEEAARARKAGVSIHAPHTGCDTYLPPVLAFVGVSIHAPHTGCDEVWPGYWTYIDEFQFTHPIRDATPIRQPPRRRINVSIHAPHTGCDGKPPRGGGVGRSFNPRTPYGMRPPPEKISGDPHYWFQSTHPIRDATSRDLAALSSGLSVSIHAPHTGCDAVPPTLLRSHPRCFNPRTPYGMRRTIRLTS